MRIVAREALLPPERPTWPTPTTRSSMRPDAGCCAARRGQAVAGAEAARRRDGAGHRRPLCGRGAGGDGADGHPARRGRPDHARTASTTCGLRGRGVGGSGRLERRSWPKAVGWALERNGPIGRADLYLNSEATSAAATCSTAPPPPWPASKPNPRSPSEPQAPGPRRRFEDSPRSSRRSHGVHGEQRDLRVLRVLRAFCELRGKTARAARTLSAGGRRPTMTNP